MSAKEWKLILIQAIAAATASWLHNLQNSPTVQDKQKLNKYFKNSNTCRSLPAYKIYYSGQAETAVEGG